MILSIITGILILIICFKKPAIGLALLIQTNIVRAIATMDYSNYCYYCMNDPDIFLGAIVPVLGLLIISFSGYIRNRALIFKLNFIDIFILLLVATVIISTFFSSNIQKSVTYCLMFLVLGVSYFFATKFFISGSSSFKKDIIVFFKATYIIGVLISIYSLFFYFLSGTTVVRLTIPGVHPIPFSQLIGFSFLIAFSIIITKGELFYITSKKILFANKIICGYLIIVLFFTNTRGVLLSAIFGGLLLIFLKGFKIKKKGVYLTSIGILGFLIYIINKIDTEVLFQRLLNSNKDKSITDRFVAYFESLDIFLKFPVFGCGPGAFGDFSILEYPHNFFLENIAQYGFLGVIVNIYLCLVFLMLFWITYKTRRKNFLYSILFVLLIFFFLETMFSFTLWMHKGLYVALGLLSGFYYKINSAKI